MHPVTDVEKLVARFHAGAIPRQEWTHTAHLAIGLWHVARFGPDEALARLRSGIRKLNESNGVPNSASDGYHESITRAYVVLLAEFLGTCPEPIQVEECARALGRTRLADRAVLLTFYTKQTLMSVRARAEWVEPDREPLRLAAIL
jgi:hypothetical protein